MRGLRQGLLRPPDVLARPQPAARPHLSQDERRRLYAGCGSHPNFAGRHPRDDVAAAIDVIPAGSLGDKQLRSVPDRRRGAAASRPKPAHERGSDQSSGSSEDCSSDEESPPSGSGDKSEQDGVAAGGAQGLKIVGAYVGTNAYARTKLLAGLPQLGGVGARERRWTSLRPHSRGLYSHRRDDSCRAARTTGGARARELSESKRGLVVTCVSGCGWLVFWELDSSLGDRHYTWY